MISEVPMVGGVRLVLAFSSLLLVAGVVVGDDSTSSGPPQAAVKPVADMFHGTRVIDNYRWLENGTSPETQKWVEEEMSYTRGMLDRLPGRDSLHKRLTELLSIGSVTAPVLTSIRDTWVTSDR